VLQHAAAASAARARDTPNFFIFSRYTFKILYATATPDVGLLTVNDDRAM